MNTCLNVLTDDLYYNYTVMESWINNGIVNSENISIEESLKLHIIEEGFIEDILNEGPKFTESDFSSPAALERTVEKIANRTGKSKEFIRKALVIFFIALIPTVIAELPVIFVGKITAGILIAVISSLILSISLALPLSSDKRYNEELSEKIKKVINELDQMDKWCTSIDKNNKEDVSISSMGNDVANRAKKYGITKASDITNEKISKIRKAKSEMQKCLIILDKAKKKKPIKEIKAESYDEFCGILSLELVKEEQEMFDEIFAKQYISLLKENGLYDKELCNIMEEHSLFNWKSNHSINNVAISYNDKMDLIKNLSETVSFIKSVIDVNDINESTIKNLQKDYINSEINAIPLCTYDTNHYTESKFIIDKLNEASTNDDIAFYADNGYISITMK